jgi:hypothetical protein
MYRCRGVHALFIGRLNVFMKFIVEYINVGGLHSLVIGGLNVFMKFILDVSM